MKNVITPIRCSAILFDMDGTLLDSNEASEKIWQTWSAETGVAIEKIRAVHHGRRPEDTIAIVAPELDAVAEAKKIYDAQDVMRDGIFPIRGVQAFYDSLPAGSYAIVTAATHSILETRFKVVGLTPPPVCVTAKLLKKGKPDPEGYLLAAEKLGRSPRDCIVFEDAPAGLLAAKNAGMRAVAITTHYTEAQLKEELGADYEPILLISDYSNLAIDASAYAKDGVLLIRSSAS